MKPSRFWIVVALGLTLVASPALAAPVTPIRYEPEVAHCISRAAQGSLWLEMTLWGLRDQEAGWVGADLVNNNGTHDLGVFQINSSWVPRLSQIVGRSEHRVSELLRYDPCFNAEVARWIFLSILHKFRDYWKAVGMYHSLTVWRQMHYVNGVKYHLKRRNWNVGF